MQVSTNGIISFQSPFNSFRVSSLPTSSAPMIAPLWADYDFREAGNVYYRVSQDTVTLGRVQEMITEANPDFKGFSPSLCVIVTWSEATLFSRRSDLSIRVSITSNIHITRRVIINL